MFCQITLINGKRKLQQQGPSWAALWLVCAVDGTPRWVPSSACPVLTVHSTLGVVNAGDPADRLIGEEASSILRRLSDLHQRHLSTIGMFRIYPAMRRRTIVYIQGCVEFSRSKPFDANGPVAPADPGHWCVRGCVRAAAQKQGSRGRTREPVYRPWLWCGVAQA